MRRRAFTLLEMLVAIGLTLALLAAMFGFFWDLLATRQRIIEETSRRRAVDTLIEALERDLLTAVAGDRVSGAGVAGDEQHVRILSRGVPARLAERRGDQGFADLERTEYRFDESARTLSARREAVRTRARPERGERRVDADRAGAAGAGGAVDDSRPASLGGGVHRVRFRYHDGDSWVDAFDSLSAESLPLAIEVAVWFDRPASEALAAGGEFEEFGDGDEPPVPPNRLTFEPGGGFDERAFAIESDLDLLDEPRPDRIRVIGLADAAADPAEATDAPDDDDEEPER